MALAGFFPRIRLMIWENTHNLSGGRVIPLDVMEEGCAAARRHSLSIHLDGARIFNAVAATGTAADRFAALTDTVQFCFSKGLGAPVGSVLCGPAEIISEARYMRKRLGGAMRQVGVVAAAARIALRDRDRLVEDHKLARLLVEGLGDRISDAVDPDKVESNMVHVRVDRLPFPLESWQHRLQAAGVKVLAPFGGILRIVTHRDVDGGDVDRLLRALDEALSDH
jgi:threonine aldolase